MNIQSYLIGDLVQFLPDNKANLPTLVKFQIISTNRKHKTFKVMFNDKLVTVNESDRYLNISYQTYLQFISSKLKLSSNILPLVSTTKAFNLENSHRYVSLKDLSNNSIYKLHVNCLIDGVKAIDYPKYSVL